MAKIRIVQQTVEGPTATVLYRVQRWRWLGGWTNVSRWYRSDFTDMPPWHSDTFGDIASARAFAQSLECGATTKTTDRVVWMQWGKDTYDEYADPEEL